MYEKHFSLKCKPFELVPNPDFLYQSSTHKKAITYLDYGIKEKIGFILLTGEIGSGKTTLIRNLIKNLDTTIKLSRITNTKVTSEQLISMINEDFGLHVEGKSKTTLLSELNEFLIDQYARKRQAILLIDEAQNLTTDLLEEVRLLSNLETDQAKLLQIILVGQPELNKALMLPNMMQLRQRINISYHINPLQIDETLHYIRHRLAVAGNAEVMKFQGNMAELIYRFSRGIPRLINILCDLALLATFVEGAMEVTPEIIDEVIKDLESRDNWDMSDSSSQEKTAEKDRSDQEAVIGDIALRIIKLEESLKKVVQEITALSDKVSALGNGAGAPDNPASSSHIKGLQERISRLEGELLPGKRTYDGAGSDDEDLNGQLEVLSRMLGDVNRKLGKM
jgi:putative secretion ATPase (PEP-CTERM system associated)